MIVSTTRFCGMRVLLTLNAFLAPVRARSTTHYVSESFSLLWASFLLIGIDVDLGIDPNRYSTYITHICLDSILLIRSTCSRR